MYLLAPSGKLSKPDPVLLWSSIYRVCVLPLVNQSCELTCECQIPDFAQLSGQFSTRRWMHTPTQQERPSLVSEKTESKLLGCIHVTGPRYFLKDAFSLHSPLISDLWVRQRSVIVPLGTYCCPKVVMLTNHNAEFESPAENVVAFAN